MKYKFFKENNDKLIIFFNGWGMDDKIVSHLNRKDFDLLVLYDYRDLDIDFPDIKHYSEKYLVAWSMGVMVSTLFDFDNIKKYIAINGTPKAIDNKYGIPERIYKLTVRGFSPDSCKKFMERMFSTMPPIDSFSGRTFESQKEELENIMGLQGKIVSFDKQIVSNNDNIIPTKNQLNYWKNPEIINSGHCPFFEYESWLEIL
ncbi:MAG: pimeloyl-ACP methyl esterase BioG family protein [Candidatus Gastranaerophilaceae bacterium]